jgi:hypothetical protein
VRLTASERGNGHSGVPIWNVTAATPKYTTIIEEKFLSRNGTSRTLTIQMNSLTNDTVISYTYEGGTFISGEATVLVGEIPTVATHNSNGVPSECAGNSNNETGPLYCRITGIPSPTVSQYCGSTRVRVQKIQNELDDVICRNLTCDKDNFTVVAVNCFGNAIKTVSGECSPQLNQSNVISMSASNSPEITVITLLNSSNNSSEPFHNSTSKLSGTAQWLQPSRQYYYCHLGGYVPWEISVGALCGSIVFLTIVVSLIVYTCYRYRRQRQYNINRHVQFRNEDSDSLEDISPYIVTPGSRILETIDREKGRSGTKDSQTRTGIYCSIDLETSDDDGYLVPVKLTDRDSKELVPNRTRSKEESGSLL